MAKTDPYFQFPLPLIGTGQSPDDENLKQAIVQRCITAGIAHRASKIADDDPDLHELPEERPSDYTGAKWQKHVLWACSDLHTTSGSLKFHKMRQDNNDSIMESFAGLYGGAPMVRIRADLMFSFCNDPKWRLCDFQVCCAVFAMIGSDTYKRTTHDRIALLATGAKDKKSAGFEHCQKMMTRKQIGTRLEKLQKSGLIQRVLKAERYTYVSNRLKDSEALAVIIAAIPDKRSGKAIKL